MVINMNVTFELRSILSHRKLIGITLGIIFASSDENSAICRNFDLPKFIYTISVMNFGWGSKLRKMRKFSTEFAINC